MIQTILNRDPFELFFKDFFNSDSTFNLIEDSNYHHPVDIYETENGLSIEIATVGANEDEIDIKLEDNILRVFHEKETEENQNNRNYICRNISKKSFNLGWKIGTSFDVDKIDASFDNGLLKITIPYAEKPEAKQIQILPNKQLKNKNK